MNIERERMLVERELYKGQLLQSNSQDNSTSETPALEKETQQKQHAKKRDQQTKNYYDKRE